MHHSMRQVDSKATREIFETQVLQIAGIEKALKEARNGQAQFFDDATISSWLESWGTPNEKAPPR